MYKVACLALALFAVVYAVPTTPGKNLVTKNVFRILSYHTTSPIDTEQVWVAGNLSYAVPTNALVGGYDPSNYLTYVGRVKAGNDILPARVVVETGTAYYNTETASGKLLIYDFLVAERNVNYVWVRSYDGFYEKNAVSAGTTVKNERVYFCRARTDGGLFIGTLLLPQKVCIIKHESLSLRKLDKYEVLVAQPKGNGTVY